MSDFNEINKDAAAAYAEVMERTAQETVQPASREPVRTNDRGVDTMDDVVLADKAAEKAEPVATGKTDTSRDTATGRFTAKSKDDSVAKPAGDSAKAATKAEPATTDTPDKAAPAGPSKGPPSSWSIKSKAKWDGLPEEVRADIEKREGETAQGLSALRDYKDLKPYAELATKHGTTIPAYLERTVKIDQLLSQNLGAGLAHICHARGLDQQTAANLFATLAKKFGGKVDEGQTQNGTQNGLPADDPLMQAMQPLLGPIQKRLDALDANVGARTKQQQDAELAAVERQIAEFAAKPENRFYNELEPTIFKLISSGVVQHKPNFADTLRDAYDIAAHSNPQTREALIEQRLATERENARKAEQDEANRKRAASRSLTGAGTPGLKVTDTKEPIGANHRESVEADVRRAYQAHAQAH